MVEALTMRAALYASLAVLLLEGVALAGDSKLTREKGSRGDTRSGGAREGRDVGGGEGREKRDTRDARVGATGAVATGTATASFEAQERGALELEHSPALMLTVQAGVAQSSAGDLDVPVEAAAAVAAGVPFRVDDFILEPRALLELGAIPFDTRPTGGMASGTAMLSALFLEGRVGYAFSRTWSIHIEAGLGSGWLSGLDGDNSFTKDGKASAALEVLAARAAFSVEARIGSHLVFVFTPVAGTLFASTDRLRPEIGSMKRVQAFAGLGWQF